MKVILKIFYSIFSLILVIIISVTSVFIILEIYLRVSGTYHIVRVGNELDYFGQFDPSLGWVNKPGAKGLMGHVENIVTEVTINQHGMRDKEYELKKNPFVKRIAVMGDSFTFGLGVNNEEIYTEVLENKLGKDFEVLNFGVGGYGVDQDYLLLKEKAILFKPDIVLCGFYVGNDLFESSSSMVGGYEKPMFKIINEGIVLTNVPVPKKMIFYSTNGKFTILIKKILRNHLYSYGFLVDRIKIFIYQFKKKMGNRELTVEDISAGRQVIHTTGIYNPDDPANKQLYQLVEKIILEMKLFCDQRRIEFCLIILPYYGQLNNNNNYPQRRISSFCAAQSIYAIDLLPKLKEISKLAKEDIYYRDDMHWTKFGHTTAANIIYEYLINSKLSEMPQGGGGTIN